MAEKTFQIESDASASEAAAPSRFRAVITNLRTSAVLHWQRTLAFCAIVALLMAGIGVAWTYMVRLAIESERAKLDQALAALDGGDYEQASSLVRHVLASGVVPRSEYGTPLFVLGAVKTHEAGTDVMPEQRRTQYLVASRYLSEARSYGFPPEREKQGLLLLGKSLVETLQVDEAVAVLTNALEIPPKEHGQLNVAIHRLLAEAYTLRAEPQYALALGHVKSLLDDNSLTSDQRVAGLALKAKVLNGLHRFDEARQAIASIAPDAQQLPAILIVRGQVLIDSVEAALERLPLQKDGELPPEIAVQVDEAVSALRSAEKLANHSSEVMRRVLFLLGRASELRGDNRAALKFFTQTHQQYADSPEGLAAKLAEADIQRRAGDDRSALLWYRQVLQSNLDPAIYRSDVLPIGMLRSRMLEAVGDFIRNDLYGNVIAMLNDFSPLFSRTQELELRGKTLRQWGKSELNLAGTESQDGKSLRRSGLQRLREAGIAFERLALMRFATPSYGDDLWNSADCYYLGQSYTNAARVLDMYLQNEPEKRNAEALLRLGQVCLSLGRVEESTAALNECIELYDRDNATYQARIDCAKAYWFQGDAAQAERLLRVNLTESMLEPKSPEWKDSLFALGVLLFDQGRYEDSISTLEEAVERYPNDRQTLQARYVTGEAYRRWAAEPMERAANARTTSERQKSQQLATGRLTQALKNFKEVQSCITLQVHNAQEDAPYAAMRRNCYMLEGACLFDLGRYQHAIEAYQNVSSLYPNEPFVLETFVQIANCWLRLDRPENARGAIEQARITLGQLPGDADFAATTAFSQEEWLMLLGNMSKW